MFPKPRAGHVIRYAYLWQAEYAQGREEGVKDRPCAVILTGADDDGADIVTALPITHTPPSKSEMDLAVEIPSATKRRLDLDDARSWILVSEANRFAWPGPDVRPLKRADPASVIYGELPGDLLLKVTECFATAAQKRRVAMVRRTD